MDQLASDGPAGALQALHIHSRLNAGRSRQAEVIGDMEGGLEGPCTKSCTASDSLDREEIRPPVHPSGAGIGATHWLHPHRSVWRRLHLSRCPRIQLLTTSQVRAIPIHGRSSEHKTLTTKLSARVLRIRSRDSSVVKQQRAPSSGVV